MKAIINFLFGTKRPRYQETDFDLNQIHSILLKPIGYALGDTILHITHLKQLKENHPHLKLGVFVTERCQAIYAQESFIEQLIFDTPINYLKQRRKWDLYLDFQPNFTSRSIFLDAILRAKFVINFGKKTKKHYNLTKTLNYDFTTQSLEKIHFSRYLFHSILGKYLPLKKIEYQIQTQHLPQELEKQCWQTGKLRILLAPQGSCREIPVNELRQLLEGIRVKDKISLLLSYTPNYAEYAKQLDLNNFVQLAPKTSIIEFMGLIYSADIIISVDSAAVHIACAYQKTLLAFFANTPANIQRWKPNNISETLMLISQQPENNDSNTTQNFPIELAIEWLNSQIQHLSD